MTINKGFKKLFDIRERPWWPDPKVILVHDYLLLEAEYEPCLMGNVTVGRGQLFTTKEKIAMACEMTYRDVRTAFEKLIKSGDISVTLSAKKTTKKGSLITLLRFDNYDGLDIDYSAKKRATTRQEVGRESGKQIRQENAPFFEFIESSENINSEPVFAVSGNERSSQFGQRIRRETGRESAEKLAGNNIIRKKKEIEEEEEEEARKREYSSPSSISLNSIQEESMQKPPRLQTVWDRFAQAPKKPNPLFSVPANENRGVASVEDELKRTLDAVAKGEAPAPLPKSPKPAQKAMIVEAKTKPAPIPQPDPVTSVPMEAPRKAPRKAPESLEAAYVKTEPECPDPTCLALSGWELALMERNVIKSLSLRIAMQEDQIRKVVKSMNISNSVFEDWLKSRASTEFCHPKTKKPIGMLNWSFDLERFAELHAINTEARNPEAKKSQAKKWFDEWKSFASALGIPTDGAVKYTDIPYELHDPLRRYALGELSKSEAMKIIATL